MDTLDTIKSLGLSDKEARVYVMILEHGPSSPQEISNTSGLKRPTVYVILGELMNRGIASFIPYSKKKMYRVISPDELFQNVENKIKSAKERLPEIKSLQKSDSEKPYTLFFDGVEGIKQIMSYKLEEMQNDELLHFMSTTSKKTIDLFGGFREYNKELKNKKISMRGITPSDSSLKTYRKEDKEFGREVKEVDLQEYKSNVSIEMGKTWVKIVDLYNLQGIIIQNETITRSLKQIFEMVYSRLEK